MGVRVAWMGEDGVDGMVLNSRKRNYRTAFLSRRHESPITIPFLPSISPLPPLIPDQVEKPPNTTDDLKKAASRLQKVHTYYLLTAYIARGRMK